MILTFFKWVAVIVLVQVITVTCANSKIVVQVDFQCLISFRANITWNNGFACIKIIKRLWLSTQHLQAWVKEYHSQFISIIFQQIWRNQIALIVIVELDTEEINVNTIYAMNWLTHVFMEIVPTHQIIHIEWNVFAIPTGQDRHLFYNMIQDRKNHGVFAGFSLFYA